MFCVCKFVLCVVRLYAGRFVQLAGSNLFDGCSIYLPKLASSISTKPVFYGPALKACSRLKFQSKITLCYKSRKSQIFPIFFNSICSSEVKATENLFNLLLLQSKFYCFALVLKTLTRRVLLAVLPFLSNLPLAMMPAHRLRAQGLGMSDRRQG